MASPLISVIVVIHNMRREAERTLLSLSVDYQRDVSVDDYEVHVVENGSSAPVDAAFVARFGPISSITA